MGTSLSLSADISVSIIASLNGKDVTLLYEVPQGCTLTVFKDKIIGKLKYTSLYNHVYISAYI